MSKPPITEKISCPICRTQILPGEPVCWVCYGGQAEHPKRKRTPVVGILASILAGIAISVGSLALGIIVGIIAILAMILSFLEEVTSGCSQPLLILACVGLTLVEFSLLLVRCFF